MGEVCARACVSLAEHISLPSDAHAAARATPKHKPQRTCALAWRRRIPASSWRTRPRSGRHTHSGQAVLRVWRAWVWGGGGQNIAADYSSRHMGQQTYGAAGAAHATTLCDACSALCLRMNAALASNTEKRSSEACGVRTQHSEARQRSEHRCVGVGRCPRLQPPPEACRHPHMRTFCLPCSSRQAP